MLNTTTFVGLDVHARSIKAVALDAMTGEVRSATFGYDAAEVAGWVSSVDPSAKCVYESGVTGFDLQKRLASMGIDCVVGAVSKMIKPAADRKRKNDRNDAEFLASMLSVGNVVEVWVPDDECEAARDLVRALDDAREDLKRCKQRLSKFLLRHGLVFERDQPDRAQEGQLDRRPLGVDKVDIVSREGRRRRARVLRRRRQAGDRGQGPPGEAGRGRGVEAQVEEEGRLRRCLKGIDVQTAADLVFEAGEFSRFKNARSFAAWIGLTPSEHSSGESVRQGGITKAGNKHLRRVLVESAWHYLGCSPAFEGPGQGPGAGPRARGATPPRA